MTVPREEEEQPLGLRDEAGWNKQAANIPTMQSVPTQKIPASAAKDFVEPQSKAKDGIVWVNGLMMLIGFVQWRVMESEVLSHYISAEWTTEIIVFTMFAGNLLNLFFRGRISAPLQKGVVPERMKPKPKVLREDYDRQAADNDRLRAELAELKRGR